MLEFLYDVVWGVPALLLTLGIGLYLSVRTGFAQIRLFPAAFRSFCGRLKPCKEQPEGVSSFQALCTALAATVGTGNLAGVAGAIAIGGPGAIFWMWICGVLGMIIKFAEATLAVHYRVKNSRGELVGGPMYMIRRGLPKKFWFMAGLYSFFGVVAAFGVGNATQINTVVVSINETLVSWDIAPSFAGNLLMGLAMAALIGAMLWGGASRIGRAAERLVPFAAGMYVLLGFGVLILKADRLPQAFGAIVEGAFAPSAVTGGVIGSAVIALRTGISRGVFTNEAGMGTASIAHSSAQVKHPVEQGYMGIIEVFLDTLVICSVTALVILCSGVPVPYGMDAGIRLTASAFACVYGAWVFPVISLALCLFALATVLGWGLYGTRCAQYLFGDGAWKKFVWLQMATVVAGAVMNAGTVWKLSEIVNGLMAIPNLLVLAVLSPQLLILVKDYKQKKGKKHEDLHQCQPLRVISYAQVPSLRCGRQGAGHERLSPEHRSAGSAHTSGVL